MANHFRFKLRGKVIYQYAVSFDPDVPSKAHRYNLLALLHDQLAPYIFDGGMLFCQKKLEGSEQGITFAEQRIPDLPDSRDMVIKLTRELKPNDTDLPLQLYNMMFKKFLRVLSLKQIGRHFYDPNLSSAFGEYNLEIWPGYFTAINCMDIGPVLIADVSHKVIRVDTVLDFINAEYEKTRNINQRLTEKLLGQVVLTRYSNRTYRIDDVDWDKTPKSKFFLPSGQESTYAEYYANQYGKTITRMDQPLIVHHKKHRGQPDELIYLIPELSFLTGIADAMRQNYEIMRYVSERTRVAPPNRVADTERLIKSINENPEIKQELDLWDVEIDNKMIQMDGMHYGSETLIFGDNKEFHIDPMKSDWSNDIKYAKLVYLLPSLLIFSFLSPPSVFSSLLVLLNKTTLLHSSFLSIPFLTSYLPF
jgi:aubergine-like protein